MKEYYVYIITNIARTLYTGMTSNLPRRVWEHKTRFEPGFTSRYKLNRLVYYEVTSEAGAAIQREKQIKGWLRKKKIALVETVNPEWRDLSLDFMEEAPPPVILREVPTASGRPKNPYGITATKTDSSLRPE